MHCCCVTISTSQRAFDLFRYGAEKINRGGAVTTRIRTIETIAANNNSCCVLLCGTKWDIVCPSIKSDNRNKYYQFHHSNHLFRERTIVCQSLRHWWLLFYYPKTNIRKVFLPLHQELKTSSRRASVSMHCLSICPGQFWGDLVCSYRRDPVPVAALVGSHRPPIQS